MEKIFETNLQNLTQEKKYLNSPMSIKEFESIIKELPTIKKTSKHLEVLDTTKQNNGWIM